MTEQWSIAITGEEIFAMPEDKRYARIVEPSPVYAKDEQGGDSHKPKVIVNVELSDGRRAQYYPNRTSARVIARKLKTDLSEEGMKKWVGQTIYWDNIADMTIAGQQKKVLYVSDVKLIA